MQNSVLTGELWVELELSNVAVGLGVERTEYDPNQFAGAVYRIPNGTTIIIHRTRIYFITGLKSYTQVQKANNYLLESLRSIGVDA